MTSRWPPLFATMVFLFSNSAFADSSTADVQEIMQSMNRAYAGAMTYRDDGVVLRREGSPIEFSYQFVRPNFLRFSWRDKSFFGLIDGLSVVRSDGQESSTCRTPPLWLTDCRKEEGLVMAMAGAAGVSHATTLFRLLTRESSGFPINQLEGMVLVGKDLVEGTDCYRVTGNHPRGFGKYEVWIGTSDFLIRKIKTDRDEEIHRNIVINTDMPANTFRPAKT
jgi:hypothetical protein